MVFFRTQFELRNINILFGGANGVAVLRTVNLSPQASSKVESFPQVRTVFFASILKQGQAKSIERQLRKKYIFVVAAQHDQNEADTAGAGGECAPDEHDYAIVCHGTYHHSQRPTT